MDGPRGKGMQDIAAPRDTRGRNLHDGAGDVLQSSSPPTTKSLVAPVYEWPILLGLSLGKSIYSDYRSSCISHPRPLALLASPDGLSMSFIPVLFHLSTYTLGSAEQRFHFLLASETKMVGSETARQRNTSCIADFFHYDFLITIRYADSIIPNLAFDI